MTKKQTKTATKQAFSYDDLFVQLGLAALPEADKKRLMDQMQENIEGRIMIRILTSLSDADKKAFDACKTDKEVEAFFASKNIEPAAIAIEEALSFREDLLKDASYIEGRLASMK